MNRDKVLELAQKAGFNWPEISTTTIEERLERFAALIEAEVRGDAKPVAYETDQELWAADAPDINNWIRKNGRPLYRHPTPAVVRKLVEALKKHHARQTGLGRDMSHSLSKLIVSAYQHSGLCEQTEAALAAVKEVGL